MKKYLFGALALPLLFACSSDDLLEEKVVGNDQFAGIEKIDATFSMDEGPATRMDQGSWDPQEGDKWGFAWMTDDHTATPVYTPFITIDGKAFQNHNLIQTSGVFAPQTSIYVGKYYLYRPYDSLTVSPKAIDFKSLENQTLAEGYASTTQAWKDLAKTAINIGDKFTEVTPDGADLDGDGKIWNNAGTKGHYKIYGAFFSNQTGLDLSYTKNKVEAPAGGMHIAGATDIDYTIAAGTELDAADIYEAKVQLEKAAKSFSYAPISEPNPAPHDGAFWADKSDLNTNSIGGGSAFTWATGTGYDEITLTAEDEDGVSTDTETNKGWFWFNSLPVTDASGATSTVVKATLTTSYGVVTINSTVGACAYVFDKYAGTGSNEWIKLSTADASTTTPKTWNLAGSHNTFINQYGNHKGKFELTANFSQGVMNGMHIKNDAQLQKLLKYYIAAGKSESGVELNLDADADGNFKISKISIALLQTINAGSAKVLVKACATHGTPKIIVTQEGQEALGLADKKEVPALNDVFALGSATDVYLASGTEWTWAGGTDGKTSLPVDADVNSLTNEGTLTVNATKFGLSIGGKYIKNAAGATMNITKVTTVHNPLTNLGTINVGSASNKTAELRAYGVEIMNDATALDKYGVINNYGVVGVTDGTPGKFNNYGLIEMKNGDAITLLSANELVSDFDDNFNASTNKMGTVNLPENNPTAIVSVNNKAANGFIKYTWPATETTYVTPEGNVKYNTIVVSGNIEFTETETEIQYIEFNGVRTQVVNPGGFLTSLKGVIVNAGKSIIIEKGNKLQPSQGTFLGEGATVYNGGTFKHNAKTVSGTEVSNYFGNWSTDQIVKY